MASVRRIELSEVIGELPEIQPFNPRSNPLDGPDDLFLCSLGFEPRCLTLPRLLVESGYRSEHVVVFEYDTNIDDNEKNRQELTTYMDSISNDVQYLFLGEADGPNKLRGVLASIAKSTSGRIPQITFDVSAAANRFVVTSMAILCEAEGSLDILYSEAAIYHPTRTEYQADPDVWQNETLLGLERGVGAVRPSREGPGQHFDPLPDAIALFPTFKRERSQAVIDFVDPSLIGSRGEQIVWLVGIPHLDENQWRIDALREINQLESNDVQHEVSTLHYQETLTTLEAIHNRLSDRYKLTLSPIGSKMQALGSSLFSFIHPDARIVFAIPKEYNAALYSESCRETWKIGFGPLSELRRILMSVGKLVVDEQ